MRYLWALLSVATLLLSATGLSAQSLADERGRDIFMRYCASCHGVTGRGDGPVGQQLSVMVPDLTRMSERQGGMLDQTRLREIIDGRAAIVAHGTRAMPVWGYEFWVDEGADVEAEARVRTIVDKLIAYLRTLQI